MVTIVNIAADFLIVIFSGKEAGRRRRNGNSAGNPEEKVTEFSMSKKYHIAAIGLGILSATMAFGASSSTTEKIDEPPGAIHIARSRVGFAPLLLQAYDSYMHEDYVAANNAYQQVLATEAENIDALHGIAAVLLRDGQEAGAAEYYRRALDVDPADTLAQVWLIGQQGVFDPVRAESILLAAQPDIFSANAALGNLYAAQNRWREAQAAYLRACSAAPEEADVLFNLAVSLDQLHESESAGHYYRRALQAAVNRPAGFDKDRVAARLHEISAD